MLHILLVPSLAPRVVEIFGSLVGVLSSITVMLVHGVGEGVPMLGRGRHIGINWVFVRMAKIEELVLES